MSKRLIMVDANAYDDAARQVLKDMSKMIDAPDSELAKVLMDLHVTAMLMLRVKLFETDTTLKSLKGGQDYE